MNMCCFRLTLEGSFEHLLRRNILASIELDNAAIVKRVGIAWQNALRTQPRLRNREIRPRARCDFRYLRVFIHENSKLVQRLNKTTSRKLLVRTLERDQSCRVVLRRRSRRWWSWCRSNGSNRSLLLRRFDP